MKLSLVFTLSAVYMAILGAVSLISPATLSFGIVDAYASPELILLLRLPASMALGIAVLDWLARHLEPSKARGAIVTANTVGFSIAALLSVWAAIGYGISNLWGIAVINLVLALGFVMTGKSRAGKA